MSKVKRVCKCTYCNKEYERKFWDGKPPKNDFCSRECYFAWKSRENPPLVSLVCDYCSEEFTRKKGNVNRYKNNFCCYECSRLFKIGRYRGEKVKPKRISVCEICGKEKEINESRFKTYQHHYCSRECAKLGYSENEMWVGRNEVRTPEHKKQMRESAIKRIEKQKFKGLPLCPAVGACETGMLNKIESTLNKEILRQYKIAGYFLDGYCPEMNIAFEIDEKRHRSKRMQEKDKEREKAIQQELDCSFIRIEV